MSETSSVRTTLAIGLLVLATAGPLIKWYFAGREASERESARIEALARSREASTAARLAATATRRLEDLREEESRRPWFHYQPWFRDPRALAEGVALSPSPLIDAPAEPFVAGYFVIDDAGLAFLSRRDGTPSLEGSAAALRDAAPECRGEAMAVVESGSSPMFLQNAQATSLARQMRAGTEPRVEALPAIAVEASPLEWRTITLGTVPRLVALRCVVGPSGRVVQGFLVDALGLEVAMHEVTARIETSTPSTAAHLALADGRWAVIVRNARMIEEAAERAALVRSRFLRTYMLGAALAVVAALAAAHLVLRSHASSRRRSELAAAAAHELRTPLASIRLHAELAEHAADMERSRHHSRIVGLEAERLGRVVANVLAFARLERGAPRCAPTPTCAASLVREIVGRHRELLESRGMRVELEVEEDLPLVLADADSVAEILSNLLDNAERHSRGSEASGQRRDRVVRVEMRRSPSGDDGIDVRVVDAGPGISDTLLAAGPRAFRRGAASSGLGLGLAIATSLARAMGGSLMLGRGPVQGSVATLRLRAATPP